MARMTISIPDALQRRLRRAKAENWSAVAQAAFDQRLTELQTKSRQREVDDMAIKLKRKNSRRPTAAELKSISQRRAEFIEQITYQADWRAEKAEQYPEDVRNANSSKALRELARQLDGIGPNDHLWSRYSRIWDNDVDETAELVEHESEELRTYGFDNSESEVTPEQAVEFLKGLVAELEQRTAEQMIER